jgi:hypothetical protein
LVRYATNRTGSWQAETVEAVWNGGCSGVITTDAAGQVHIAYGGSDDCRNLRYATGNFGSWNIETVDNLNPDGRWNLGTLSIQLEAGGTVHLNYIDTYTWDLKHAVRSAGSWSVDTVAENAEQPCMLIDSTDQVHLSYYDWDVGAIIYATNNGGGWISETIASDSVDVPDKGALTTDLSGNAHVVYLDNAKGLMKYARGQYGQWLIETIDVMWWMSGLSLATDSGGSAHMVYHDTSEISYATNQSGSWVVMPWFNNAGYHSPLVVDADDNVHFVILDISGARLRINTIPGGEVQIPVENLSGFGDFKADAAGALHLIYTVADG